MRAKPSAETLHLRRHSLLARRPTLCLCSLRRFWRESTSDVHIQESHCLRTGRSSTALVTRVQAAFFISRLLLSCLWEQFARNQPPASNRHIFFLPSISRSQVPQQLRKCRVLRRCSPLSAFFFFIISLAESPKTSGPAAERANGHLVCPSCTVSTGFLPHWILC